MHFALSLLLLLPVKEQRPPDGLYTYQVAFAEWEGRSHGITVAVRLRGDSIWIIHNGGVLSGKKGSVIDAGIIMKHVPTGQWIIGHRPGDAHVKDVGGCTEGPSVINFKKKLFWMC